MNQSNKLLAFQWTTHALCLTKHSKTRPQCCRYVDTLYFFHPGSRTAQANCSYWHSALTFNTTSLPSSLNSAVFLFIAIRRRRQRAGICSWTVLWTARLVELSTITGYWFVATSFFHSFEIINSSCGNWSTTWHHVVALHPIPRHCFLGIIQLPQYVYI